MDLVKLEGRPLKDRELDRLKEFLSRMDLEYDPGIEYSICLLDEEYRILAAGSAEQNVLKCIAVDPEVQGQGISGTILSNLIQYEFENGRSHILLYTKPKNKEMFEDSGFHRVLMTEEVLFMENKKNGFEEFMDRLKKESPAEALKPGKVIGSIVVNCNPFTLGHRYLIEEALKQCDYVHVFVLSDKRSFYNADIRYQMVQAGTADLSGVILHQTSDYIVSAATFPTYFIKEKAEAEKANCRLDLELFGRRIAPALGITKRFIGTEPVCVVTGQYNAEMMKILPGLGILVTEIERKESGGNPISASTVRKLYEKEDFERIKYLVPETTFRYLMNKKKGRRPMG